MTTISAVNLGPISNLQFALDQPGVTVLVAPNGSGKSILLDAVQAAARGEGKLPLRDRTKRGSVEAFGATITIGGTCRHTGQFEVTNLEGRFDLALLVDPRLKSPSAADKARVKALVSLTGVQAKPELFRDHEAFADFDTVVTREALATEDIVEMAARIKDCFDAAALVKERLAQREYGQATALLPSATLDLEQESDAGTLQQRYDIARDNVTRLKELRRAAMESDAQMQQAEATLRELGEDSLVSDRGTIEQAMATTADSLKSMRSELQDLITRVEVLKSSISAQNNEMARLEYQLGTIDKQIAIVNRAKQQCTSARIVGPEPSEIEAAEQQMAAAAAAIETGLQIRQARENARRVAYHRTSAQQAENDANRYRDAGKAVDEVLSNCIRCKQLRVESDGKAARLVTDTARGESIAFHELSEGERWALAIDIGAEQVGRGGLLVISQVGWEGIDGANRQKIHDQAVHRGVYILTAEAASDPNAQRDIIPMQMGRRLETRTVVAETRPAIETPVETKPQKGAKAPKPSASNAKLQFSTDDDDIPF